MPAQRGKFAVSGVMDYPNFQLLTLHKPTGRVSERRASTQEASFLFTRTFVLIQEESSQDFGRRFQLHFLIRVGSQSRF